MELIIVILFFSIASVVCVQLFVNAYSTNRSTEQLSGGTVVIQNLSEAFLGCDGDLSALKDVLNSDGTEYALFGADGTMSVSYNADFNEVSANEAAYTAHITLKDESGQIIAAGDEPVPGTIITATIDVCDASDGTSVTTQDIRHYVPYTMEDAD